LARRWGPAIERDPRFPERTNVQFVQVVAHDRLEGEVWERGAGYTLASGSSACAAAAALCRLGRCSPDVTVSMPGGDLRIEVDPDFAVTQAGPVAATASGALAAEFLSS
jgi:diaminopimelate epimerase